uniref:Uncharacterized protein n=1 Tax=Helianthus annuus TaxID=4232 RepID=A0A251T807_HELAN
MALGFRRKSVNGCNRCLKGRIETTPLHLAKTLIDSSTTTSSEEINVIHSGTTTLSLSSRKCSIGLDVHSMLHSRAWVPFQVPMIDRRRLDYTMPL